MHASPPSGFLVLVCEGQTSMTYYFFSAFILGAETCELNLGQTGAIFLPTRLEDSVHLARDDAFEGCNSLTLYALDAISNQAF